MASIETKVFRRTARCTTFWPQKYEEILGGLKVEPADEKLRRHKSNWLWLVTRMDNRKMPKITLNYRSNGRIRLGRPLKRLLGEAETGLSRPNLWRMMMMMMIMIITTMVNYSIFYYTYIYARRFIDSHVEFFHSSYFTLRIQCKLFNTSFDYYFFSDIIL
jgi:hypothetical protein